MPNILTVTEAANILRVDPDDPDMLGLLSLVDTHIQMATGHDWTADNPIEPAAKSAARMLLVAWYENPAMMGQGITPLQFGLTAALTQLEVMALDYREFEGRSGDGSCDLPGAQVGDTVASLVGLIGAVGDQHTSFESVITVADEIQQTSTADLSGKYYRVKLTSLGDL